MTRLSDFDADHALRTYRGMVNPRRAAPMLPRISDGVNEVPNASELLFTGGTVTEPEDGVAQITIGGGAGGGSSGSGSSGGNGTSSANSVLMFNNSGQDLLPGDVVVTDETADNAVTVTTTAGDIRIAGIVQEPIAAGLFGKVLFNGYAALVNSADAVRGEYAQTSTTAAQADSTTDREAGSFAVYLTGTDLADFVIDSTVTTSDFAVEALSIALPATVPINRVMLLALWLIDGVSSVDIPDWTLIGAEAGFYYYYRVSTGIDDADATWTSPSPVVAAVLLLHSSVMLAVPIDAHDYENTTAAASLSGLSDAPRYAIAGVRADVPSPGSGFSFIAGDVAGTAVSPFVVTDTTWKGLDLEVDSVITNSEPAGWKDPGFDDSAWSNCVAGPEAPTQYDIPDADVIVDAAIDASPKTGEGIWIARKEFTVGSPPALDAQLHITCDNELMGAWLNGTFLGSLPNVDNWSSDHIFTADTSLFVVGDNCLAVKVKNTLPTPSGSNVQASLIEAEVLVAGTLAGKYIDHDAAVSSPFTGAGKELDAIFAVNLTRDAKPSALLYGPDLGGGTGGDITLIDAGNYFTATDVENVLQELAAKDIGYQSHGSMGSTETFSALVGWHSGTLNADCTFTFSGATSGLVASMVLELTEDGTGGWQPTWPGSVVWPGGSAPTHDDTAGTTTLYLFESRDGGSTWYGFQAGSGTTITFGTPAVVLGTAAAAGVIDEAIRRDATIVAFDATVPTSSAEGDSAATGSAAVAARRDHRHGREAFGTTAQAIGTSAGGSATTPSKSDHVHATGAGTPTTSAIGDAAATGTGPAAAMTDHVHGREALSTATPLVESGSGAVGTGTKSSREDHVHPASSGGGASFVPIGQETRTSDGSTTTWTLDNDFEENSVQAFNLTSGLALSVTETLPNSVTISAAGTAGNTLSFAYAASVV